MSRGTEFLLEVEEALSDRIEELDKIIYAGQQDVAGMNEYYWENYTEMDQYGYENFDNQQALLTQVNANQENLKMRSRMRRMVDSPFFGSVDFIYEGDDEPEVFYIGIGNFARERGGVPLVYDWRAPVSGLFYDYDKGEAFYTAPGGEMTGEITSKWQYKIRNGRMLYEFESDVKIDDDILKQELGTNSDVKLKNIVRTIQKEQNKIIRNTKDRVLAIQGAAGSGKTSVALHRIAYLLYHDREHLNSSNVLILSPSGVFSDYISHILPELGEENIQEMSFDLFAYRELKGIAADCQDRFHRIEKELAGESLEEKERFEWKQSAEYVQEVEGFLIELEDRLVEFKDVDYKGFHKSAGMIREFFYNKFLDTPVMSRMESVMEYFIDEYETVMERSLREDEDLHIREAFQNMYVTRDIYEIYNWLLADLGYPVLPDIPTEKRILEYEDVFPLLYLKYRLQSGNVRRNIRHLVVDEMQDYSYLQYVILGQLFSCNMTILGDKAQTIDTDTKDVLPYLSEIFGKKVHKIEMNKSYRNTAEISAYAKQVSGIEGIEYVDRHGKDVVIRKEEPQSEHTLDQILEGVRLDEDGYETAAVLTLTEEQAQEAYRYLRDKREDVSYIDRDTSRFEKGLIVTTFYQAKGLEFDQVFVMAADREHPFWNQYQYICATRALHELYVFEK